MAALADRQRTVRRLGGILLLVALGVPQGAGDPARTPGLPAPAVSGPADPAPEVVEGDVADPGLRVLAIRSAPRIVGESCPDGAEAFAVPTPVHFPEAQLSPIPTIFPEATMCPVAARPSAYSGPNDTSRRSWLLPTPLP